MSDKAPCLEINSYLIITKIKDDADVPSEIGQAEYETSVKWRSMGLIDNLFIRINPNTKKAEGASLVLNVKTEAEARELMESVPLTPYFESIQYIAIEKLY